LIVHFVTWSLLKRRGKDFVVLFVLLAKYAAQKKNINIENRSDNININANMAVVSAMLNTGQGYAQLEEFAVTLNMPTISNRMYQEMH